MQTFRCQSITRSLLETPQWLSLALFSLTCGMLCLVDPAARWSGKLVLYKTKCFVLQSLAPLFANYSSSTLHRYSVFFKRRLWHFTVIFSLLILQKLFYFRFDFPNVAHFDSFHFQRGKEILWTSHLSIQISRQTVWSKHCSYDQRLLIFYCDINLLI